MVLQRSIVTAFCLGAMFSSIGSATASFESDSIALYGTWNWTSSYGGLLGARVMPSLAGYQRRIQFRPDGTYNFTESDSANQYLICGGRVGIHRDPYGTWLELQHWNGIMNRERVTFQGPDTMSLYPGGGGHSVDDALTTTYVRALSEDSIDGPAPRPWIDRPPRLGIAGRGWGFTYVELGERFPSMDWRDQFRPMWDHDYPPAILGAYSYTHFQSPAAIVGDFDGNDTLDIAVYGARDSIGEVRVWLASSRRRPPVTLFSERLVVGALPVNPGDRPRKGQLPQLFLEVARAGSQFRRADGREETLTQDAIRVVGMDARSVIYVWDRGAFGAVSSVKRE